MIVDLPPPPAPVTARIEASFALPAAPPLYEYVSALEVEAPPEGVPVRRFHRPAGRSIGQYALANPINLVLDRLGFYFRTLLPETWGRKVIQVPATENSEGGGSGGLGEGAPDPVPPGDPIPVGGGGGPNGG